MTAAKTAVPSTYVSGFCGCGRHDACRGSYAGVDCSCECGHQPAEPEPEPEPERPPGPYLRLSWAALAIASGELLPERARVRLVRLFQDEAAWAADRGDTYPADRAPLLELADSINGDAA